MAEVDLFLPCWRASEADFMQAMTEAKETY